MGSLPHLGGSSTAMPLLCKLLAICIVIQSVGVYTSYAKQINSNSDLIFDDIPEAGVKGKQENERWRTATNTQQNAKAHNDNKDDLLDASDLIEDELQPVEDISDDLGMIDANTDDETSPGSDGWLMKSVKRVRRELNRLLGGKADEKSASPRKIRKVPANKRAHRRRAVPNELRTNKKRRAQVDPSKDRRRSVARDNYDEEYGSGDGDLDVDPDTESDNDVSYYRVMFIAHEMWNDNYRQKQSNQFLQLRRELEIGFRDLFKSTASPDEEDDSIKTDLIDVSFTNDPFKVHVTVQLEITGSNGDDFGKAIQDQILTYSKIGSVGAELDDNYVYSHISDIDSVPPVSDSVYFVKMSPKPTESPRIEATEPVEPEEPESVNPVEPVESTPEENEYENPEEYEPNSDTEPEYPVQSQPQPQPSPVQPEEQPDEREGEFDCLRWPENGFRCGDSRIIQCQEVCDYYTDCDDGSDEQNCPPRSEEPSPDPSAGYDQGGDNVAPDEEPSTGYEDVPEEQEPAQPDPAPETVDEDEDIASGRDQYPTQEEAQGENEVSVGNEDVDANTEYPSGGGEIYSPVYSRGEELNCRGDIFFRCVESGNTICEEQKCDGTEDCPDGEDELDCPGGFENECNENEFKCDNICMPKRFQCNGHIECRDGTDEQGCSECPSHEFQCRSGHCIESNKRCDGYQDCPDGDDEDQSCRGQECTQNEFACRNDGCIPIEAVCDGTDDCRYRDDESEDICTCGRYEFKCLRGGGCIPNHQVCDGESQCRDGSDEDNCRSESVDDCTYNEFYCDEGCHSNTIRCNGRVDCIDQTDERNCNESESQMPEQQRPPVQYPCEELRCPSGKCYKHSEKCDRTADCEDGSDERNCCGQDQFACRSGSCVPLSAKCNGRSDCPDDSDEDDCRDTEEQQRACYPHQFRCSSGQCISAYARCDRRSDCYDGSDEIGCPQAHPEPQLNLKTYPDSQIIKESREVIFRCRDEGPNRAKVRWSRPDGRPLPTGFTDKNGRLEIPNIRFEDSGKYICEAVGYPRHIVGQSVDVHLTVERYNPIADRPPSACHEGQATCMDGECIDRQQVCDGVPHCADGSDEHSCSRGRKCQPNQFMCKNSKCVDRIWRCDSENDCGDNSDEESCDAEPSGACRYDEFKCNSGHCIPKSFQCDSTNDCDDGTDEVGCGPPAVIRPPPQEQILAVGGVLNITCRGTGTPIPVIVWRLNWGHVPEKCVSKTAGGEGALYCPDMQVRDSGMYSCEIINSKGSLFPPDTVVKVTADDDVCPVGFFNKLAAREDECINCFCFGVSKTCKSAELYSYSLQPPITSHRVVGVEIRPQFVRIGESPGHKVFTLHHGVQFRASDVGYSRSQPTVPYLALPGDYQGGQLRSYGGFLKYDVQYQGQGRPNDVPDVIISGNGYTLLHTSRSQPLANQANKRTVQFIAGNWKKADGRIATRPEIMMVLANVENILLRLSYITGTEREVEVININMDSASVNDRGLGSASLVEQCSCPTGYIGDSCERCAPGFQRQPGGPWLGRCIAVEPETCPPGTFGEPRRGIPCRQCPCPLTNAENNFANGCSLGPDNEAICNCNEGYVGRRCEKCAEGYTGNPFTPGGYCYPKPQNECNPDGTLQALPDGSCKCKSDVTGPRCDQCAPSSFFLNSFTYSGCIECFCSGIVKQCSSSTWYRDSVSTNFGRARSDHGFNLVMGYEGRNPVQVPFSQANSQLNFARSERNEVLYWSLPAEFLGNKLTAYGGDLNYTLSYSPLPGGLTSRNSAPDVVIKSANDLSFHHFRKSQVSPSVSQTYTIPIIESAWQRNDGDTVNREHMLMALADIQAIYIKATYTTVTQEGTLTFVSLDTASPVNRGTTRAYEVEECRCPPEYVGLSCEACSPGNKKSSESGLYLGLCEPCECNGHSTECDPETGVCANCRDNTVGDFCDECAPGFEGNATNGTPRDCQQRGGGDSMSSCSYCSNAGTLSCSNGYCQCKRNVVGQYCNQCRAGTFDLQAANTDGCSECFCSGASNKCYAGNMYRQLIPIPFIDTFPIISDDNGLLLDSENMESDISTNMYTYRTQSYTQKYWSLPNSIAGDRVLSYGGKLIFQLRVTSSGYPEPGKDVILIGNGDKLIWSRPEETLEEEDVEVRLHEDEDWTRYDGSQASRVDILSVLSNLQYVLIRATPKIPTISTAIGNVILESAGEIGTEPNSERVTEVEVCQCPPGYSGTSCQQCSTMYYRDTSDLSGSSLGSCKPCQCGEGAESCSKGDRGYVVCQCKPGYSGDRCQYAVPDTDSKKLTILEQLSDRQNCCAGYRLETHKSGYVLNESVYHVMDSKGHSVGYIYANNNCAPHLAATATSTRQEPRPVPTTTPLPPYEAEITVSIDSPRISIIPVGGSLVLSCSGVFNLNRAPAVVNWYKLNGRLPYASDQDRGVLYLNNLQIDDSGIYICQARGQSKTFEDKVTITVSRPLEDETLPIINLQLPYITVDEQRPIEIDCDVSGSPQPVVQWIRIGGDLPREAQVDGDRLLIPAARKVDEGTYMCYASNNIGVAQHNVTIYVTAQYQPLPPPRDLVYVEPAQVQSGVGQSVELVCHPRTQVVLVYDWTKDGSPLQWNRNIVLNKNVLTIREATVRDTGRYICTGMDQRMRLNYTSTAYVSIEDRQGPIDIGVPPVIKQLPSEQQLVIQGQDFSISCEATGTPYPTIKWTRVYDTFNANIQQTGNTLRIINAEPANRGMFLCVAENSAGTDQGTITIDVEPRERPSIEIHPREAQVVPVGSSASLSCHHIAGIPTPTMIWRRVDGQPMPARFREDYPGVGILTDIELSDAGDYECVATNDVGKAVGTLQIIVQQEPSITLEPAEEDIDLTEGDELKIICIASGTPEPNVEWTDETEEQTIIQPRMNTFQVPSQAVLEIMHVTMDDAKVYVCRASNDAGSDVKYVNVRVQKRRGDTGFSDIDRPTQPRQPTYYPPRVDPANSVYNAQIGDTATLSCDIEGYPQLHIQWQRVDGLPLPRNSRPDRNNLIISRVEADAGGKYRCNAYDQSGSPVTHVTAELIVVPIPYITFHPEMPMTVRANDNVEIWCEVTGAQPIDVLWYADNGRPLPISVQADGQYLRFNSITPADAGRYYCSATNVYGNTTKAAEVVVNRGVQEQRPSMPQQYEVNEGDDINLSCDITRSRAPIRPDITYKWSRTDGKRLPESSYTRDQSLFIRVVRPEDQGRYVCEIMSPVGGSNPTYIDLIIKPSLPHQVPQWQTSENNNVYENAPMLKLDQQSSTLRVGESTEVECYSSDNTYTDVVWERSDGEPLPLHIKQVGNKLIISNADITDAGEYVCKCKTDEGDLYTTSYKLSIEEDVKRKSTKPKIEHAEVGSNVQLVCDADGIPSAFRWSRQFGTFQSGINLHDNTLRLDNVQARDAGTYICTATTNGESTDYPTILVVTGAIPHFHQAPLSYMSFPVLPSSFFKFNFDITFRPKQPNGLLLFNGQKKGSGDYISLSLNDRYPEFRFDFDGKPVVMRSEEPITLGEWHTIRVNRYRRDGYMTVDNQHPVGFPLLTNVFPLDLVDDLYIGAVPKWDDLPSSAVEKRVGFVGCISRLTLQDQIVELYKDAKYKEGITSCEPCADDPCQNDGTCLETQTEMGYSCICQDGFTGSNCAVEGTSCTPGLCGTGRCENTEFGMECYCPLNKTGDRCQYIEHLNEASLSFRGGSFVAYNTPRPSKLGIKFSVRPNSLEDSVLLYVAESKVVSGDFVAVVVSNRHVELRINTAARLKPVTIRSLNPLPLNKWTEIEISRRFGEAILRVGDEPEQKAKATGLARSLNIKTPLYIGGYDRQITLNRDVNITRGFDGCISNLVEANRSVNLIAEIKDAANVQNCGDINEIEPPSGSGYEADDAEGESCNRDPCENGGTCVMNNDKVECDCPLGFAGKHCENHVEIKHSANFRGNGYLELDRTLFGSEIEQTSGFAALLFSTKDPNGLLLWWGQKKGQTYNGQDFLAIAIVDGIVELSFRLDGEEKIIRKPNTRVDDGERHIVILKRHANQATLELDHIVHAGESIPTGKDAMSLPGNMFIGGTPDMVKFTGNRFSSGFNGCVHVVEAEHSGDIPLSKNTISAVNVDTCPDTNEDDDDVRVV